MDIPHKNMDSVMRNRIEKEATSFFAAKSTTQLRDTGNLRSLTSKEDKNNEFLNQKVRSYEYEKSQSFFQSVETICSSWFSDFLLINPFMKAFPIRKFNIFEREKSQSFFQITQEVLILIDRNPEYQ